MRPGFQGPTGSTISIDNLLDYVNKYFPDILPEETLKHYGYDARPEGKLGKSALYQDRPGTEDNKSNFGQDGGFGNIEEKTDSGQYGKTDYKFFHGNTEEKALRLISAGLLKFTNQKINCKTVPVRTETAKRKPVRLRHSILSTSLRKRTRRPVPAPTESPAKAAPKEIAPSA